jgi:hypothetical protein
VFYSFTRNNEKLATYLQKQLSCDIARLETVKKQSSFSILLDLTFNRNPALRPIEHNLRDYDHFIFVGPIWAGRIATPLKSYLTRENSNISEYSFITLCGGGKDQKEKIEMELTNVMQKPPAQVVELSVNSIIQSGKKELIDNVAGYQVDESDLAFFRQQLLAFTSHWQSPIVNS